MGKFEIPDAQTVSKINEKEPRLEKGVFKRIEARSYNEISFIPSDVWKAEEEHLPELSDDDMENNANELYRKHQEMQKERSKNEKPLDYIPFDAKMEIEKIKKERSHQKPQEIRKQITLIREKLAQQQIGVAETIQNLELIAHLNPKANAEILFSHVREVAPIFEFNKRQLEFFYAGLKEYDAKHKAIDKCRSEYPRDKELYEALFGIKPEGEVRVMCGMLILHIQCFNEADYDFAYTWGGSPKLHDKLKSKSRISTGALLFRLKIPELAGLVSIEKGNNRGTNVVVHEEQHTFNRLFQLPKSKIMDNLALIESGNKDKEAGTKERIIHKVAKFLRDECIDGSVRDELLAYYKQGVPLENLFNRLGSYNFVSDFEEKFGSIKSEVQELIRDNFSEVSYKENVSKDDLFFEKNENGYLVDFEELTIPKKDIKPYIDSVFGEELVADVKRWIDSIAQLEKMGYSRHDTLALLYQEPINKWPALARRMMKSKAR